MNKSQMRPPGYPLVPFVFPLAVGMSLLGLIAFLQYRTLCEMRGLAEQQGTPGDRLGSATRPRDTGFPQMSSY